MGGEVGGSVEPPSTRGSGLLVGPELLGGYNSESEQDGEDDEFLHGLKGSAVGGALRTTGVQPAGPWEDLASTIRRIPSRQGISVLPSTWCIRVVSGQIGHGALSS